MRKFLPILLSIIGLASSLKAQWVSPGEGLIYTLPDLVAATGGVVTNDGNVFTIHQDITISERDELLIDDQVSRIDAPGVLITINGTFNCNIAGDRVKLYGTENEHFSMRFENAKNCLVNKMYFSDGAGIQVIESDITFDDVKFVYFTTDYCNAVINIFNCDPVINNCFFMLNQGAAISSPANGQSSPQITNCELDANVNGMNVPQINLGPGSDDTIRIVGNNIHGTWAQFHTGGISVADLMGVGSTKVLLKDNIVKDGRYGYNQQGMTISSLIEGNQFLTNYHEENPMNGGSGISIYGTSLNNKAIIRNNVIVGNLWGITAIYLHDIDLGTEEDWGFNEIHDNVNNGVYYDLYNNSACNIMAVGNDWGTVNQRDIEGHIVHQVDDPSLGLVTFVPYVGYTELDEIPLELSDIDLHKALIYTISGQRVKNTETLTPGVYVVVTEHGTNKIIIQ
ncbi:MAG: DUF1565 domain-containing protein [Bacteroidales bacterium]|nr:DUF1565 domain-containing protein [Bacteroidales bacterium]